nr:molybdopterin biosynthesis protein MoeA2 [Mycolicibacter nonchromogenicus]
MRSVEEHQRAVSDLVQARLPVTVALADAEGLVLAADVIAPIALPVFDNSGMDGYAVLADDVAGASSDHPVSLPVTEDIPAGRTDIPTLTAGTAHRIMTGAPIPYGADAVVPVEATDGGVDVVAISSPTARGRHIRRAGGDVAEGATVLWGGQIVSAPVAGLAAALGLAELTVHPRQRVLVISTGSELIKPGTPLDPYLEIL